MSEFEQLKIRFAALASRVEALESERSAQSQRDRMDRRQLETMCALRGVSVREVQNSGCKRAEVVRARREIIRELRGQAMAYARIARVVNCQESTIWRTVGKRKG